MVGSGANSHDGSILRKAFQKILKDPQKYQDAQNDPFWETEHFESGIAESGVLTNTFLLVDKSCIDSVTPNYSNGLLKYSNPHYDNMHILGIRGQFPCTTS